MRKLNAGPPPRWLRLWMIWATRAGDGWLWAGAGIAVGRSSAATDGGPHWEAGAASAAGWDRRIPGLEKRLACPPSALRDRTPRWRIFCLPTASRFPPAIP